MAEIHQHVSISRKIKHLKKVIERIKDEVPVYDFQDNIKNLVAPIKSPSINEGA